MRNLGKFSLRCAEQSEIVLLLLFKTCFHYIQRRRNREKSFARQMFRRVFTRWDFYWFTAQIIWNGFSLPSTEQTHKNVKQTLCCLICLRKASNSATIDRIGFARSRTPVCEQWEVYFIFLARFRDSWSVTELFLSFSDKKKVFLGRTKHHKGDDKFTEKYDVLLHSRQCTASCTTRTIELLLNFKYVSPSRTRTSVNIHVLLVNLKLLCRSPFKPPPVEQIISLFRHFPDMNYDETERSGSVTKWPGLGGKKTGVLIFFPCDPEKFFAKKIFLRRTTVRSSPKRKRRKKKTPGDAGDWKFRNSAAARSSTRINRKFSGRKCRHEVYFDLLWQVRTFIKFLELFSGTG